MKDCIFCKIIAGEIPAPRLFENTDFIAIQDIQPQATTHFLVIPKRHVHSLVDAVKESGLMERAMGAVAEAAEKLGLKNGFRTVINTGEDGGQTVFHLHVHVLSGKSLSGSFG